MWGFAVIAFALVVSSLSKEIQCPTVKDSLMTPELRQQILGFHNKKRARLASGLENNKNGKITGAKNMYKLKWNCILEKKAQNWLRMGSWKGKEYKFEALNPWVVNYDTRYFCRTTPVTFKNYIEGVLTGWWGQAQKNVATNRRTANNREFANMAFGYSTKVGCSITHNGPEASLFCLYENGPMLGMKIYEIGEKCKKNEDCSKPHSTCSVTDSLCTVSEVKCLSDNIVKAGNEISQSKSSKLHEQ
ncbi:SCP-like protein [Oesophagostomum dentatum]|uniref:SCP-like protein n=1 Tax=Oesophagostomum dentatum TaxID=61180 RepID=A0A0B1TL83_OESDE|nr:SCP-like protein [Oesophagostomum dentatum]